MGRTDDAVATLRRYRVNLPSLRFGAGQKGKVADGFLSGTPIVATPVAAESMNGPIDWGCPVTADAAGFARAAVTAHENVETWKRVREQVFLIARQRLSAKEWRPRLIDRLERLIKNGPDERHRDFIGRLLRHHQHRSTEYMSRWIEAKNK